MLLSVFINERHALEKLIAHGPQQQAAELGWKSAVLDSVSVLTALPCGF